MLLHFRVFHDKWRWEGPYFYFWSIPCNDMQYLKVNNALTNFVYCVMGCTICCLFTCIIEDDLSYEKWCKIKRLYLSFNRCSLPHYFVFKKVYVQRYHRLPNSYICHKYCVSLLRLLFSLKPLSYSLLGWHDMLFLFRMDFVIFLLVCIV